MSDLQIDVETHNSVNLAPNETVKVISDGNGHIEVKSSHTNRKNSKIKRYKKIDFSSYVDTETGEIHQYKHTNYRAQNPSNLRQTFDNLHWIIGCNFVGEDNEYFITLTEQEVELNLQVMTENVKRFIRKTRTFLNNEMLYICIYEPNDKERQGFHEHILLKDLREEKIRKEKPLNQYLLHDFWKKGYVCLEKISSFEGVSNLCVYLTGRYSKQLLNEEQGLPKDLVKDGRIHLYPRGMRIYQCSRNVKRPEQAEMSYEDSKIITCTMNKTWSQTKIIKTVDGKLLNKVTREQFTVKTYKSMKGGKSHDSNENH